MKELISQLKQKVLEKRKELSDKIFKQSLKLRNSDSAAATKINTDKIIVDNRIALILGNIADIESHIEFWKLAMARNR